MNIRINKSFLHPVIRRWIDWILLTSIAVLICILLQPFLSNLNNEFILQQTHWALYIQYSVISLLSGGLLLFVIRLGGFHVAHIRFLLLCRYPPAWLAGIVGTIIYLTITTNLNFGELGSLMIWGSAIPVGFIIVILVTAIFESNGRTKPVQKNDVSPLQSFRTIIDNPQQLLIWIKEETPIQYPWEDLFGLSIIARRISRILLNERLRTIGLVGTYGCGKTSLLNLVEYYLYHIDKVTLPSSSMSDEENQRLFKGQVLVCRVDGWGRSKGSVDQQILSIAVNRLRQRLDCLSIITVPTNYRKALEGSKHAWASIIAALLQTSQDPIKQLEKMDDILGAGGIRLIIFLEDLDRNISDEIIRDELPSLLDRLRCLNYISFILAIGTEHRYSNILIRICDHVEAIV